MSYIQRTKELALVDLILFMFLVKDYLIQNKKKLFSLIQ